mgnify:CR=1 FL=1
MNPTEIMAFIVAFFTLGKMLTMLFSQKSWFTSSTKRFWAHPRMLTIGSLVAVIVSLWFLLQELTIVQVFAVTFFSMSLIVLGLAPLSKYMLEIEEKWFKEEKMITIGPIAWIVWSGLSIWVLYTIFMG